MSSTMNLFISILYDVMFSLMIITAIVGNFITMWCVVSKYTINDYFTDLQTINVALGNHSTEILSHLLTIIICASPSYQGGLTNFI